MQTQNEHTYVRSFHANILLLVISSESAQNRFRQGFFFSLCVKSPPPANTDRSGMERIGCRWVTRDLRYSKRAET